MSDARVEELVGEYVERRERGEALDPEAFAAEHHACAPALLAALRALADTEALFPGEAGDLPARVGPYAVRGEIGRGGMGRVLEVDDPERPGGALALKLLHLSLVGDARALERFRREGGALERLSHPSIVRVHASGLIEGRPYLAMEKIEGAPLAEHLNRARESGAPLELPGEGHALERVARLVARLARALAEAHRAGVLHRDLNPRNVLVRDDGEPVVIDFGLMRAGGAPTLTGSGDLLGTPQYMAPEQARGERVDERTDVFGLGLILRECLTLAPPRDGQETLALVREASTRPLRRLDRAACGGSRALATIVRRATSFFPRWRHPSCDELAADLELFLEGEPIRSRPAGWTQLAAELLQVQRRAALAAATLLVAGALAFGLHAWTRSEDVQRRRVQGTTSVAAAALAGDTAAAREALADYRASESDPPLADYLAALLDGHFERSSDDPASRAMLAGERALNAGLANDALDAFLTAWDLAPHQPIVLFKQGLAAVAARRYAVARPALELSSGSFPAALELHRALAELYAGLQQPQDERRALRAVLALEPDDDAAWLALARLQQRLGADAEALAAALRAHDPAARDALAEEWERAGASELARGLRERP